MLHILLLLALPSSSFGAEVTLSNANDFLEFAFNVSSGSSYSEDTVYLGSDITLTGSIDPIGDGISNQFRGTFDGQGHVISNLQIISSSSNYTGLFGFSEGLTIRNVVLDSSCSITNAYRYIYVYIGGIIGYCYSDSKGCNIENSVNMADVTFGGSISGNLFIGGIVGDLCSSPSHDVHVKNCVNYGSVTDSGTVGGWTGMGGIVGYSGGNSYNAYIQNCLNYGTITHSGTSTYLYVGGIIGYVRTYTYIENCVSAGKIFTQTTATNKNYIGSVVGYAKSNTHINYCYFTNDVNASSINGTGTLNSMIGTLDTPTDVDFDLVSKLNANVTSCNWDKWFMLHLNGGSINNLTQESLIEIQGRISNPVKEGNSFLFWCKDAECNNVFDPETETVEEITALYAAWVNNTVTFDFDNGTTMNVTFKYNTEIIYPDVKKEGYTLSWDNYHELMPARGITVTAQWTPNNYTVTFDANGGNDLPDSETTKTVTFGKTYVLPKPNRTGYMFIGWFTENNESVTNETIVITPKNHTLYAHWEEITNWVEIVFDKKDLTKEEAENIIKKYTTVDFEIIKFENDSGELTVIIEFVDKKDAENFIENINKPDWGDDIKQVGFVYDSNRSFSLELYPLSFLNALFL